MKSKEYMKTLGLLFIALIIVTPAFSEVAAPVRLSEKYPDLSHGILFDATLQELADDVLVRVQGKEITREMVAQKVDALPEEERADAGNYLFYVLENMVTEPIMLILVLGSNTLPEGNDAIQQLFKDYISNVVDSVEVSEEEAKGFYDENPEMFPESAFKEVNEMIIVELGKQKKQAMWNEHKRHIGLQLPISVNAAWVAEQAEKARNNPVDKALAGEKPVMVLFSAEWCPVCQQLAPVIEKIKNGENQDVVIVEIDTDKNSFLSSRFDVSAIPLLVFYNEQGSEVDRHTGFMPEEEIVEKLKALNPS